ncbi:hypothetical protein ACO0RG_002093 [Hanseniaspora osmophila]
MPQPSMINHFAECERTSNMIASIYAGEVNVHGTQEAIKCKSLIEQTANELHIFCHKVYCPIAVFALTTFTFEHAQSLVELKKRLDYSLSSCTKCIESYTVEKAKLFDYFKIKRNLKYDQVSGFANTIDSWRCETLVVKELSRTSEIDQSNMKIVELMYNPRYLRVKSNVHTALVGQFTTFFVNNQIPEFFNKKLTPGLIFCYFQNQNVAQYEWAKNALKNLLDSNYQLDPKDETVQIVTNELFYHFLQIQISENNISTKVNFYFKLAPILELVSKEVLERHFLKISYINSVKSYFPNFKEFLQQLVCDYYEKYENKPLHLFFRIFTILTKKLKSSFWTLFQPCKIHNIIDVAVERKDVFLQKIVEAQNHPFEVNILEFQTTLQDYIQWIEPLYDTVIDAEKKKLAKDISSFFLKVISRQSPLTPVSRGILLSQCTQYLNVILEVDVDTRNKVYTDPAVESVLYQKSELRDLVEHGVILNMIIEYATRYNAVLPGIDQKLQLGIATSAINIVLTSIDFDIVILCFVIHKLYVNPNANIHEVRYSTNLITSFSNNFQFEVLPVEHKEMFTKNLFKSLKNANGLLQLVNENTPRDKKEHINKYTAQYVQSIVNLLSKIYAYDFEFFRKVLLDEDALLGFWSCVFTSSTTLYNIAIDLLYGCFDQEDRLANVKMSLELNFSANLKSIGVILHQLIKGKFYEPCPRAIFVLTDILQVLMELLAEDSFTCKFDAIAFKSLHAFWTNIWEFLTSIYINTFQWANLFDLKEVMEFCKNAMDLNKATLDSYETLTKFLGTKIDLARDITASVSKSIQWLKLADPPLLDQCSKLVVSTLKLAHEVHANIDKPVLLDLFSISKKKDPFTGKKRKCYLTTTQSSEIIAVLFLLDSTYTSELQKKLDEQNTDVLKKENLSSASLVQQKLPMFKREIPQAKKPTLSSLQKAELQLKNKRISAQAARVVHPARKGGFNDDSETDDSDDDDEVNELFGRENLSRITKKVKKQSGIELLDYTSKSKGRSKADQEKLEEEYMNKRLNVDINPFYAEVLKWDYRKKGDYPTEFIPTQKAQDKYKSVEEYQKVIKPLLMLETWQGICSSRDRNENTPFSIIIGNRILVGEFYEVYASVLKRQVTAAGITEADLIVLASGFDPAVINKLRCDDFKASKESCLAKVKEIKGNRGEYMDLTFRISRSTSFGNLLSRKAEIYCCKVTSMTTVEREYKTLEGLPYYNLLPTILSSQIEAVENKPEKEVSRVEELYQLNNSQAEAIVCAVSTAGVSLVQGPPGTGKTKTILGIVRYYFEKNTSKNKLLLCAPSNAAVDELILRLHEGYVDEYGEEKKFKMARIGRSDAVNPKVKQYTLDDLVEQSVTKKYDFLDFNESEYHSLLSKRDSIKADLESKKFDDKRIAELLLELKEQNGKLNEVRKRKDEVRESNKATYRNREYDRKTATVAILKEADIICSTLSGSANDLLAALKVRFPTVIIDEACQCTELSSIVPMKYGAKNVIMVGDPNQLPPTVLSGAASSLNYENPLFSRLVQFSKPYLLNVQYRMHPSISKFPSKEFYEGRLKDGPQMDIVTSRPWHSTNIFSPYMFFDVARGVEERNAKTQSLVNMEEIYVAMEMVQLLFQRYPKVDFKSKIGIISPYKQQVRTLKSKFVREFGENILKVVDCQTIDGFQGQEKDIIIISCVRADENSSIGFLKDFRRLNVALTRGKCSMWILGHHESLVRNKLWRNLINDAKDRRCLTKVDKSIKTLAQGKMADEPLSYDDFVPKKVKRPLKKEEINKAGSQVVKASNNDDMLNELEDSYVPLDVPQATESSSREGHHATKTIIKKQNMSKGTNHNKTGRDTDKVEADDAYEPGTLEITRNNLLGKSSSSKKRSASEQNLSTKPLKMSKVSLNGKKSSSFFNNSDHSDLKSRKTKKDVKIFDKTKSSSKISANQHLNPPKEEAASKNTTSDLTKFKGILKSTDPSQKKLEKKNRKIAFDDSPQIHKYDQCADSDDGYEPENFSSNNNNNNNNNEAYMINGKKINTEKSLVPYKRATLSEPQISDFDKQEQRSAQPPSKKKLQDYLNKSGVDNAHEENDPGSIVAESGGENVYSAESDGVTSSNANVKKDLHTGDENTAFEKNNLSCTDNKTSSTSSNFDEGFPRKNSNIKPKQAPAVNPFIPRNKRTRPKFKAQSVKK